MADTLIASGNLALVQTHLSLVAGTAFADLEGVNLGLYLGKKLVVWDSSGRPASAYILTAGSGETLAADTLAAHSEDFTTGWTNFNCTITNATTFTMTGAGGMYRTGFPLTLGGLYKGTLNGSATLGVTQIKTSSDATSFVTGFGNSGYATADATQPYFRNGTNLSVVVITWATTALQQVLTPSIMGVVVSSKPNGTAGDAWSIIPNFNYNDSSGYTWAVMSESSITTQYLPEDKTQIDRRPRGKVYFEPFASFQAPGSSPVWVPPLLVDDIRRHTDRRFFSKAYYENWTRWNPPTSAARLPMTQYVDVVKEHTNLRRVSPSYFDFSSKSPTQKDGNINPSPLASGRYRGWASNWAIGVKEDFPWS